MRLRAFHAVTLLPVLLSACAGVPPHEFLPGPARDKLTATEVAVPIRQSEIYVFVPQSNIAAAGGGGLLLALIDAGVDSVRTTKAEDAVKPLRDATVDFDFDSTLQNDLKTSLSQVAWMHADNFHVVKTVSNDSLDGVLAGSKDSAVLFTTTNYCLSNDADVLDIFVHASLFPNSPELRALKPSTGKSMTASMANALYQNTFVYESHLLGATGDRDQNIAMLSADHGAMLRSELKAGAAKLSEMLAADLPRTETDPVPAGKDVTITNQAGLPVNGSAVATDSGGSLILFKDGTQMFAAHAAP
jgi:hypothetical protein